MEIFLKWPSPFLVTITVRILFYYPFSFFSLLNSPPFPLLSIRSLHSPKKHEAKIENCSGSPSCPTLAREKKRERERVLLIELLLEAAKGRLYRRAWQEVAYLFTISRGYLETLLDTLVLPQTEALSFPYTFPHFQLLSPDYSQCILIILAISWNDPHPLCTKHYTSPLQYIHKCWASQLL